MPRNAIRGLSHFITDLRACPTRDLEALRVQRELAKLRQRVTTMTTGYERKKCVWKLVYISMLGYPIPFGHMEAVNLLASQVYSEKVCGYIASALLLSHEPLILGLATNTACLDIRAYRTKELFACLALEFVANAATPEMATQLWQAITAAMFDPEAPLQVRKKGYLAALRLVRAVPDLIPPDPWCDKLFAALLQETEAVSSLVTLILGVLELQQAHVWLPLLEPCAKLFCKVSCLDSAYTDLTYAGVPAPWLRIKLLRIFQFFRPTSVFPRLLETLSTLVTSGPFLPRYQNGSSKRKNRADQERVTRSHVEHAVYLEAVNLLVAWERIVPPRLRKTAALALSATSYMKDANLRCMRLESLGILAKDPDVTQLLQKQMGAIAYQLAEPDVGVQRQSVQLLAALADGGNWRSVVSKLTSSLSMLHDELLREEAVLITSVLIEKFAPDVGASYNQTLFELTELAPSSVPDAVRHRGVFLLLSGSKAAQAAAAEKALDALADSYCPEKLVELSGYLLGEFGALVVAEIPASRQVALLARHLRRPVAVKTLLTALAKLAAAVPKVQSKVLELLEGFWHHSDPEIQTRAVEFHALLQEKRPTVAHALAQMPPVPHIRLARTQLLERLKITAGKKAVPRPQLEAAASTQGGLLPMGTVERPRSGRGPDGLLEAENDDLHLNVEQDEALSSHSDENDSVSSSDDDDDHSSYDGSDATEDLTLACPNANDASALWRYTTLMGAGPLFSGPDMRIAARYAIRGSKCRMAIDITGNTMQQQQLPMHVARCAVACATSAVEVRFLSPGSGPLPLRVAVEAELRDAAPFPPPQLTVAIHNRQLAVPLPLQLSSFLTSTDIPAAQFNLYWTGAGKGAALRVVGTPLPHVTSLGVARAVLSKGLGFCVHALDKGVLCGSASLIYTNQAERRCACLLKVELRSGQLTIALRVNHPHVTEALLAEIAACLITRAA